MSPDFLRHLTLVSPLSGDDSKKRDINRRMARFCFFKTFSPICCTRKTLQQNKRHGITSSIYKGICVRPVPFPSLTSFPVYEIDKFNTCYKSVPTREAESSWCSYPDSASGQNCPGHYCLKNIHQKNKPLSMYLISGTSHPLVAGSHYMA